MSRSDSSPLFATGKSFEQQKNRDEQSKPQGAFCTGSIFQASKGVTGEWHSIAKPSYVCVCTFCALDSPTSGLRTMKLDDSSTLIIPSTSGEPFLQFVCDLLDSAEYDVPHNPGTVVFQMELRSQIPEANLNYTAK